MYGSGHFRAGHFKAGHFQSGRALIEFFVSLSWAIRRVLPVFKLKAVNPGRRFMRDAD